MGKFIRIPTVDGRGLMVNIDGISHLYEANAEKDTGYIQMIGQKYWNAEFFGFEAMCDLLSNYDKPVKEATKE